MHSLPQFPFPLPHACYPTCAINSRNQLVMLHAGSHNRVLTVDYSTLYIGDEPLMNCKCGFNGCRRIIMPFKFIPVIFQDYYLLKDAVCREVLLNFNLTLYNNFKNYRQTTFPVNHSIACST